MKTDQPLRDAMLKRHIFPLSIMLLSIAGILLSYALAEEYHFTDLPQYDGHRAGIFTPLSSQVCGKTGSFLSCENVSKSNYSRLFGFPVALYGLWFYLMTFCMGFVCWLLHDPIRKLMAIALLWMAALGLSVDVALFFVSYIEIKALCPLCLFTYGITLLLFGLAQMYTLRYKISPLHPIKVFKPADGPYLSRSLMAGSTVLLLIILSTAGICYATQRLLIQSKIDYITTHKEREIKQIVSAFAKQRPQPLRLPALVVHGDANAPVTILEISDFLCPYCAHVSQIMEELIHDNPEKLRVLFVNFPLDKTCNRQIRIDMHIGACELAKRAICAAVQGKLHDYQSVAFANRKNNPTAEDLDKIIATAGLDQTALEQCLDDPNTEDTLQWQIKAVEEHYINATPTIFINRKQYQGRIYKEALQQVIDLELKKAEDDRLKSEDEK